MYYFPEGKQKVFTANSGIDKKYIENYNFFKTKIDKWNSKQKFNIIIVSSLIKLKNIDINIKLLSKLKKYNWIYNTAGNGKEMKYLKN